MDRETSLKITLKEFSQQEVDEKGLKGRVGVTAKAVAHRLGIHRSNASHHLNNMVKNGQAIKIDGRPVLFLHREVVEEKLGFKLTGGELIVKDLEELVAPYGAPSKKAAASNAKPGETIFDCLIGCKGSLARQIEQAKAAVLYPPNGLHCLVVGPTGSGKSMFAKKMYEYAIQLELLKPDSELITFNCADYANNPQLLFSQLFGYVKGAFSGAAEDKIGLVEMADGGMLFLDEIHRLTPEGQEMLFHLMDYGTFRRLGEAKNTREAQVRLIGATTLNPDSALLETFLRRIPLIIKIPSLEERPLAERMDLVANFFSQESEKFGLDLNVEADVFKALLLYECPGNIGQLRGDIQLMCALAFVEYSTSENNELRVDIRHIKQELKRIVKTPFSYDDLLEQMLGLKQKWFKFSPLAVKDRCFPQNIKDGSIYSNAVDHVWELVESKLPKEAMHDFSENTDEKGPVQRTFCEVVSSEVMKITDHIIRAADISSDSRLNERLLFFTLSIHLSAAIKNMEAGNITVKPNVQYIKQKFSKEYGISCKMAKALSQEINMDIPEEEIAFMTLILNAVRSWRDSMPPRVGIVVISPKKGKAANMVRVAQSLLNTDHGIALDISGDLSPNEYAGQIKKTMIDYEEGKGVIFLYEPSSIKEYIQKVSEDTGVKTKIIHGVSAPIVIEAVRLAIIPEMSLSEIAKGIEKMTPMGSSLNFKEQSNCDVVVLATTDEQKICFDLRKKIIENLASSNLKVIHVNGKNEENLRQKFIYTAENYHVVAVIGSVDPGLIKPFIDIDSISIEKEIQNIYSLLNQNNSGGKDSLLEGKGLFDTIKSNLERLESFWSVR